MIISETQQNLRGRAAQAALASVKMAKLTPSLFLESLLSEWGEGRASLDEVGFALSARAATYND
jgi:hypothetical protein